MENFGIAIKNLKTMTEKQNYGPALFWVGYLTKYAETTNNQTAVGYLQQLAIKMMTSLTSGDKDMSRLEIIQLESATLMAFGRR
jgi:hypothetical protein